MAAFLIYSFVGIFFFIAGVLLPDPSLFTTATLFLIMGELCSHHSIMENK